jgi:hypothetical protein
MGDVLRISGIEKFLNRFRTLVWEHYEISLKNQSIDGDIVYYHSMDGSKQSGETFEKSIRYKTELINQQSLMFA